MEWIPIILIVLLIIGLALVLTAPRNPQHRGPKADWVADRRHWAGAPDKPEEGE
jgi:hypothetical protein